MNGRFDVIMAHPEALLCTRFGRELRNSALFINNVLALFVDECHTADQWLVSNVNGQNRDFNHK